MVLVLNTHPTRGSSIPRYIAALLAALREHPEMQDPDAHVHDGFPPRNLTATHLITVGGFDEPTADGDQQPAQLGGMRREESYTVNVYCTVQTGSDDQGFCRDQAFALLRIVEEVLQRDPTMSQQNVIDGVPTAVVRYSDLRGGISLQQTGESLVEQLVESERRVGRVAQISAQITVRNRIELD